MTRLSHLMCSSQHASETSHISMLCVYMTLIPLTCCLSLPPPHLWFNPCSFPLLISLAVEPTPSLHYSRTHLIHLNSFLNHVYTYLPFHLSLSLCLSLSLSHSLSIQFNFSIQFSFISMTVMTVITTVLPKQEAKQQTTVDQEHKERLPVLSGTSGNNKLS